MPNAKNIDSVAKLKEKTTKAKAVIFTDYRGLTHKQLEEMRKLLRKVAGEYTVGKNTLVKIALKDSGFKDLVKDEHLTGTTGVLFAYEDEISPIKELYKFAKATNLPSVKLAYLGNREYSASDVETISKLPGVDALRGQVVGALSSPMYGLMYALNGNLQKLVYVLGQIKK